MIPTPIRNAMTIDVEDYFHVSAFAPHVAREDWVRLLADFAWSPIDRVFLGPHT